MASVGLLDLTVHHAVIVLPRLRPFGFTQAEIDLMTKTNPARFLGLEKW